MKVTHRRRQIALRTLALSACAAGVLALTACSSDSPDAAPTTTAAAASPAKAGNGTEATAPATAVPAGKVSTPPASKATPPPASPTSSIAGSPNAAASAEDDGCDHKMPISPDEIAVYRYTPEGGSLSLIFRHGNWGCGTPDSDGAPFETVGKETYLPLDQAAYITVTNPIVTSTENQHIGVQEFLDWLEAHPDSGLVFQYHVGADGAIDSLEQIFTP
ncbi:hypothetical protein [Streptomyces justiciae]|uniref:hypothetical protein n=1 Tax=Streptomyces justiciae TaxID=2780140 RepID=UPI00187F9EC7|nr:hypothetical protein [Streptomyces justiciae]MBE8472296.1 hypothetical protein [Streptomyces justiciae]